MAYGSSPGSALSIVAFLCAGAVLLGYGPMLGIAGVFCAVLAVARGEGLGGIAVLVAVVVMGLSFVLPSTIALNRL